MRLVYRLLATSDEHKTAKRAAKAGKPIWKRTVKAALEEKLDQDQLGGTGQILPWHVFWTCHAGSCRSVPTAFKVGSRDVTWTSRPTPLIPFRVFSRVSRAPFLRQSGVVTETQFLIGLRGLLCICSSSTGYRWAMVFQKQSGTLRPHGLRGPCEHATPVFSLADTAPFG
jgi:hypothetical protein